ncbi:ribonuclease HII [Flagellimonas myxillae]|uniref:ribonuclease HII n=1 Tax=Flagellimonas myxillae TaxID=2942214 RepID=UPI00201F1DB7|nr:ribonuclease HII [Muricauda myxillae]MCL6267847.1 ribonuclease HII [Muricauda myxillae]
MKCKALLLVCIFFICCKPEVQSTDSLLDHLLPSSSLIVKINNLSNFKSELKNSAFLEKIQNLGIYQDLEGKLNGLDHLDSEASCLLAFYEVGKNNHEFIMTLEKGATTFNADSIPNRTVENLTYQNKNITKYTLGDQEVYSAIVDDALHLTSSQILMENMLRSPKANAGDETLKRLYNTSTPAKTATLFFNMDEPSSLPSSQIKESENRLQAFSDWLSLDFEANSDHLSLSGVTLASDSTKNFINLFKGTHSLAHRTPQYAPQNTQALIAYTFDDYSVFAENQNVYLDRVKPVDSLFKTVEELGVIHVNNEKVVLLNAYGAESISTFLESDKTGSTTYQGNEIISLKTNTLLTDGFDPLLTDFKSNFCSILEDTFVFSENREELQTLLSNYKSRSTFDQTTVFQTAAGTLASESSILFVSTASGIRYFADEDLVSTLSNNLKPSDLKDHAFAAQFVSDNGFSHANMTISKIAKSSSSKSVTPLFTLELDTDLAIDPQFVKNHRTNKQEVVVQDQNNVLHLISTDGKILWKKQLEGRVQGRIQQVDIYKNGRLQLAFCTNNQFLIIDRNGEDVPPFTKTFEGGNLNPLAVFDYEGRKDYRFVITQGERVYMYNNRGNIVDGFTYTRAQSPILSAPKHFRVSNKDFLVFELEDKTLKILHRSGGDRIKVAEKIDFSGNGVFLYKDKFSVTNKKGVLHQIDIRGKLSSTNFNLGQDHGMFTTSKTLVFMDDNVLSIKGKKVELDLGVYTQPKIFYIYDKIYVSVTDIQNQKIYLFDSQAKPIPNFPVFGNSLIDMVDIENDRKLELVAKDQENSIIVYRIN